MAVEELFAAVYANPDDDGPRGVLADLLQEQGDPRGEFIALQLARGRGGKKTRRESQLLKPNLRTWLGPLLMAIPNKGLVYERGFVAKCQLQHHRESIEPHLHHREWATVEEVRLGRWNGPYQSLADALPSLRVLVTAGQGQAGQLPSHPKLERIEVGYVFEKKHDVHLASLKLPSLRELAVTCCYATLPQLQPFLQSATALQRLTIKVPDLDAWIPWLAKRGYQRAGVRSTMNPWTLWFEGDRLTAEYCYTGHEQPRAASQLASILDLVPSPKSWNVSVTQAYSWQGTTVASIKRGAATALKQFASYVVDAAAE
jgi:uncharacterized protein (TIGR02996 family)